MQKHRVFTAINLPESIKKELLSYKKIWPDLPARWVNENNIHITLNFLGYIPSDDLMEVFKAVENVTSKHSCFYVKLNKIQYGPEKKIPPRMIWVKGEKSDELSRLKNDLDKALDNYENRGFSPHITLARIRAWDFKKIDPEERPEVLQEIDLSFEVESIEVMESVLKKGGPEYTILERFNLK
jgi:2'-5' RNA ligase